ncbi:hypothetical protein PR202_gb02656 [Eleusine coracana subsp. coracana]|uniref:Uncharacterized protein n=1 Tax=Eleusine coracana subsp. coracana TaxID=191504 RepID=A0AAV5DXB3_ELECO|nr:hypothetical protein PR202_gb02656 [Eleusine coracana subsp. coracana]
MVRRCPRRAEISRRVDEYYDAHRAEPPSPSAAETPEEEKPDSPPLIEYFRQRYWKCYRSLTGMGPNPGNSLLSAEDSSMGPNSGNSLLSAKDSRMEPNQGSSLLSAEDSICPPPEPEKKQLTVPDKDDGQCDGDRHSSECVCAYQIVPYKFEEVDGGEVEQGTHHFSVPFKRRRQRSLSIAAYAVQCATCKKWRFIPTKQKYEEFRAQIKKDPFTCELAHQWKPDVTCNDPSDVSQDGSWLWAMDQHNIPQPPPGFDRLIAIRGEGCTRFADVYYATPSGRKLRSSKEIENYLKENPDYAAQGVNLSQFSFKIPAPAQQDYVRKRAKTNGNDDSHKEPSKPLLKEAWLAPPMHEEPGNNAQLIAHNGGPSELRHPEPSEVKLLGKPPQPPAA